MVDITCLCGRSKGSVEIAAQSLPVETLLCHCKICRYTSGVLCVTYLILESPPRLNIPLTNYQSSAKMIRQFCRACGSHIFAYNSELYEWYLTTGVIETLDPSSAERMMQTTKLTQHEFVSETLDGGLALCLASFHGRKLRFFAQGPDEEPSPTDANLSLTAIDFGGDPSDHPASSKDQLHASCHCGNVQFIVSRPNEQSTKLSSPWPDLLVPYHSGSSRNDKDEKWWLKSDGTKYLAGTCACRSCRLASGFSIQTWAFIPKTNLTSPGGQSLSFEMGGLQQYESTPGIYREFCGRCGATVFWHCDERPDLIDVSVGLLRAEEGSRAETWLHWWRERVSFKEDAIDRELINALERGLASIREQ